MVISLRLSGYVVLAIAGLLVLSSCSDDGADPEGTVDSSVVTLLPSEDPVDADVPADYVDAVLADVSARSGVATGDLTVLDSTGVEWADQRLGCVHLPAAEKPQPVDGYRVVVDTGEAQFDYRLDGAGTLNLCGAPILGPGGGHEGDDHGGESDQHHAPPEESSS